MNPRVMVGNEFIVPQPRLRVATPLPAPQPTVSLPIVPITPVAVPAESITVTVQRPAPSLPLHELLELAHRFSIATFALLFLMVGTAATEVGANYWSAHIATETASISSSLPKQAAHTIAGLNITLPTGQLASKIQAIIAQPISLTVGDKVLPVSPDTIRSWLQISAAKDHASSFISVRAATITASLTAMAQKYAKDPVNQVTVSHDGVDSVVVAGRNGASLTDLKSLTTQAQQTAKSVMDGKGLQFNTPLTSTPFQAVTPAAFNKLIEVNVVTKQMYLYDNGQLSSTYPISAGATETPTPIGEYHIYSKLPVQDMKGFNANGTPYNQPHVHWISYFLPGGYAVHGNYWRPQSWFGVINSSHGCVSLPDAQAKEVYDWAPVGTTVITHT